MSLHAKQQITFGCLSCLVLSLLTQVQPQCFYNVGIDANTAGTSLLTEQAYNLTFVNYLTEQLAAVTECKFRMTLYSDPDAYRAAAIGGELDFLFAGPGVLVCLQSQLQTQPLASLIAYTAGQPVSVVAGAAIALANRTDLNELKDIEHQRITMMGISILTSGQAQWRELQTQGLNPLVLARQVLFINNQQRQVMSLMQGHADVAFVRADQIAILAAAGFLNVSDLKVLSSTMVAGYPYPVSTRLYPNYGLAASNKVPLEVQEAVVEALFAIQPSDTEAVTGGYYRWSTSFDYLDAYQMQLDTGALLNGSCLNANDTYDMVQCPAGSYKLPRSRIGGLCAERGLPCPAEAAECICNFCRHDPSHLFGRLRLAGFLVVLLVGLSLIALLTFCITRVNKLTIMHIPFAQLHVSDESEVLGEGMYGKVLKGEYRGTNIAVKRLLPPNSSRGKSSIFDVDLVRPSRTSQEIISFEDIHAHDASLAINVADGLDHRDSLDNTAASGHHRDSIDNATDADPGDQPASRKSSVLYTPGQQFLLSPSGKDLPVVLPISTDSAATAEEGLIGTAAQPPTKANVAQLQESDIIEELHFGTTGLIDSPDCETHWADEASRLDLEYEQGKKRQDQARYEARSWQDMWHGFTRGLAAFWRGLTSCFLFGPVKAHLRKEGAVQETLVALRLRHPNIVTVMGTSVDPHTRDLLLVTAQLERGTLYDLLHNDTFMLDNEMILSMLRDVVAGLAFLHAAVPPIYHQDLRSSKILLDSSCRAHLSDYHQDTVDVGELQQHCFPFWVAPELLQDARPSAATDVYAVGMLLYEMLYRTEPFSGEDSEAVMAAIHEEAAGEGPSRRPHVTGLIDAALVPLQTLMHHCWHQDATLRPSLKDIDEELAVLVSEQEAHNESLAEKRQQDQALLHQMLPPQVAAALREGRAVEPESYDCVTIFFSDIVGFTNISGLLQPQEVMEMLDRLYRLFDELTQKYNLFKVETIGDAYMTVANLRCPQQDHAALVARFAIEATQAANSVMIRSDDSSSGFLSIRAGIHSGPVVASVVGNVNPRYCLFGDTVNVASRMESSSLQNRIQMSKATAQLLVRQAPDLRKCVTRRSGQQAIKGKGFMRTYWLHTRPVEEDAYSVGTMASGSRCASQLGVHRSSSIANSVASSGALSAAARVNSDSSDSKDTTALKDVAASQSSWSERKPAGRVRSVDVIPEFAPVREESTDEKSDTALNESSQLPEPSDPAKPRSSHEFAETAIEAHRDVVRKRESVLSRGDRQNLMGTGRAVPRKSVHVGFVQPF